MIALPRCTITDKVALARLTPAALGAYLARAGWRESPRHTHAKTFLVYTRPGAARPALLCRKYLQHPSHLAQFLTELADGEGRSEMEIWLDAVSGAGATGGGG
jgi:hypothetical protein